MKYSRRIDLFETRIDYMLYCIHKLDTYLGGVKRSDFEDDDMLIDATAKMIENIGEHANQLDNKGPTFTLSKIYSQVKWRKYSTIRHLLVHQYEDIVESDLFDFYHNDLHHLKNKLYRIKDEIENGKTMEKLVKVGKHENL
jgi:uncharacterized protein with HEPN domain